jgi:hypothetical protein
VLHSPEHGLGLVTVRVKGCVMLDVQFAVLIGGGASGYPYVNQRVTQPVGIMAPIRWHDSGRQQPCSTRKISGLTGARMYLVPADLAVTNRIQPGMSATLGAPDLPTAPRSFPQAGGAP